ncbi:hypothetical protein F5Y12DRAFT_753694 [Xylaria sp. FL1777]|nr:hypothetical protein F5Y12DRAFT_753694 [Xylaria sp. FL1777]
MAPPTGWQKCEARVHCYNLAVFGRKMCSKHLEVYSRASREKREAEERLLSVIDQDAHSTTKKKRNEATREYHRRRSERLKASGLCVSCGKNPAKETIFKCSHCADKFRKYGQRYKACRKEKLKKASNKLLELELSFLGR